MIKEKDLEKELKNPEKYIPSGHYCCTYLCPFWDRDPDKGNLNSYGTKDDNGYCHYLKVGDWNSYEKLGGFTAIFDGVKACGINEKD